MNIPANPITGLKGALAGLMSGGWMGLVLHLFFLRRITAALTALESLFAQWQAGTLAPLPAATEPPTIAPAAIPVSSAAAAPRRPSGSPRRTRARDHASACRPPASADGSLPVVQARGTAIAVTPPHASFGSAPARTWPRRHARCSTKAIATGAAARPYSCYIVI